MIYVEETSMAGRMRDLRWTVLVLVIVLGVLAQPENLSSYLEDCHHCLERC